MLGKIISVAYMIENRLSESQYHNQPVIKDIAI